MTEYIKREAVKKVIDNVYSDLYPEYVPNSIAAFRECIMVDIGIIPAADVQPVSVIKELQEHIKQRILETAFNNGGIYGEVAEDIADRIDIWVDEFRRSENMPAVDIQNSQELIYKKACGVDVEASIEAQKSWEQWCDNVKAIQERNLLETEVDGLFLNFEQEG